eukprot:730053_1
MDNKANNPTVLAQWDYIASKDAFLTFSKGDQITVLKDVRDDGWCRGRLEKNNNVGWFNMAYIITDPTNVNQICFCRQPLTKYQHDWPHPCKCCCKKYEPNEMQFYWCSRQCVYRKTSASNYVICAKCYET